MKGHTAFGLSTPDNNVDKTSPIKTLATYTLAHLDYVQKGGGIQYGTPVQFTFTISFAFVTLPLFRVSDCKQHKNIPQGN